ETRDLHFYAHSYLSVSSFWFCNIVAIVPDDRITLLYSFSLV
ncbi:unnamed protein product, partial [Brassica oleracea var. botrytis]